MAGYWQETVHVLLGKLLASFWKLIKYYYFHLHFYCLADLFVVFFAAKKDSFFLRLMKLRKQINQDPILSSAMERAEHK